MKVDRKGKVKAIHVEMSEEDAQLLNWLMGRTLTIPDAIVREYGMTSKRKLHDWMMEFQHALSEAGIDSEWKLIAKD